MELRAGTLIEFVFALSYTPLQNSFPKKKKKKKDDEEEEKKCKNNWIQLKRNYGDRVTAYVLITRGTF